MSQSVHLVCEIGAFPAPLVRLIWALARQRRCRVDRTLVLTHSIGATYVVSELYPALSELSEVLGDLAPGPVDVVVADLRAEVDVDTSEAWSAARWAHYCRAVDEAGTSPVIFALVGGRQRAASAMAATMYCLLAREGDFLLDVRLDRSSVEPHTARPIFYHPEQGGDVEDEYRSGARVLASEVGVHLIELPHPRMAALFGRSERPDFPRAVRMATTRVEAAARPLLVIDLKRRRAQWGGADLRLGLDHFIVFAALAEARRAPANGGQGDGWAGTDEVLLRSIIQRADAEGGLRNAGLKALAEGEAWSSEDKGGWLSGTRARLSKHLQTWFDRNEVSGRDLLTIEKRWAQNADSRWHEQRLVVPPERIFFL
ncbi:MAG: hypothetical protein EXR69_03475 [Myxococcales bacterium]|nr:hypothetical protein [Myxococcales bacterium]